MSFRLFVFVGLLLPAVTTAQKYTNESWQFVDELLDKGSYVLELVPQATFGFGLNCLNAFDIYANKLETFANSDNITSILSETAAMVLYNFDLLSKIKGTPEDILIELNNILPKVGAGLRQVVSSLRSSIGSLTNRINDAIKLVERTLQRLLREFSINGVKKLALGRKSDFEPVTKSLQKLTKTIALISDTILNDSTLATNDNIESVTVLTIILTHCFVLVQGTQSMIAAAVQSNNKVIPDSLNSFLHSVDPMITGFADSIESITDVCLEAVQRLIINVVGLTAVLDETLKHVFGLVAGVTLTVGEITQDLLCGVSTITSGLTKLLG